MKNTKICFAASSGGHFEQISMLRPLMSKYESFVVTEHTEYRATIKNEKMYYVHQVNRKEVSFPFWMVVNAVKSIIIFLQEKRRQKRVCWTYWQRYRLRQKQEDFYINLRIDFMFNGNQCFSFIQKRFI